MNKYFELKALATHVVKQLVDNTEADRIEIGEMVVTHFPEFIYTGKAYRYRYGTQREFKPQAYKSYAKTVKGANIFLDNEKFGFKLDHSTPFQLIEAEIKGVDLVALTKHLVKLGFIEECEIEIFYSEEEIISLEINQYRIS